MKETRLDPHPLLRSFPLPGSAEEGEAGVAILIATTL